MVPECVQIPNLRLWWNSFSRTQRSILDGRWTESMTAEGLWLKKEEGVKKSSCLRNNDNNKIIMSFSCSLHRWTQTCWLAGFFGSILIFFIFAEKLKANAPSLHQQPANWCSVTSRTATARRKIGKSLKKLSNKTLKIQSTEGKHLPSSCFFILTCFMMKALNKSSLNVWCRFHCFWKLQDFVSTFMLQREKRSDGTKLWIQWREKKQTCVISQLNWLLMFLNILNVSVYVLNLTFFFFFSETEYFFYFPSRP